MNSFSENRRNRHGMPMKSVITIALISFAIPFGLHLLLKQRSEQTKQDQQISEYNKEVGTEQMLARILEAVQAMQVNTLTNIVEINPPVFTPFTNYVTLAVETNTTTPPKVEWLASPVTQAWKWDSLRRVWITTEKYQDSMQANPSIEIGLREDGLVVWRKVNKTNEK